MFSIWEENAVVAVVRPGSTIVHDVDEVAFHPLFNANTRANNIVLIKVDPPIAFVPNVVEPATLDLIVLRGGVTLSLPNDVAATVSLLSLSDHSFFLNFFFLF